MGRVKKPVFLRSRELKYLKAETQTPKWIPPVSFILQTSAESLTHWEKVPCGKWPHHCPQSVNPEDKSSPPISSSPVPPVFPLISSFFERPGISPFLICWKYVDVDIGINFTFGNLIWTLSWPSNKHFRKGDNTNISHIQWSGQESSWRHTSVEPLLSFSRDWQGWHKSLTRSGTKPVASCYE